MPISYLAMTSKKHSMVSVSGSFSVTSFNCQRSPIFGLDSSHPQKDRLPTRFLLSCFLGKECQTLLHGILRLGFPSDLTYENLTVHIRNAKDAACSKGGFPTGIYEIVLDVGPLCARTSVRFVKETLQHLMQPAKSRWCDRPST